MIDWDAAVRTGQRLAPRGPDVSPAQARDAVDELRHLSGAAELRVRETTGLGRGLPVADADVVDRSGWIAATSRGMAVLTRPLEARLPEVKRGTAAAGAQIGVVLGYLSGKVLGQFDPLGGEAPLAQGGEASIAQGGQAPIAHSGEAPTRRGGPGG